MRFFVLLILSVLLSGCTMLDNYVTFRPKKDWDLEKQRIEREYNERTSKTLKELEDKQKEKDTKELNNLQKASGLAYGILQLSEIKPVDNRTRPDNLINFKSKELVTRLPNLPTEEILKINEELKKELDEKNSTLTDLQKKYQIALDQAEKDKALILSIQKDIDSKKQELTDIQNLKKSAELELEVVRRKAAELEASEKQKKAEEESKKAELIKYLIKIFVGIGVVTAILAYATRSIILATGSAGAFGLSIFIAVLEPWMIIVFGTILVITILAGIGYRWYETYKQKLDESDVAERLVGSIQQFREKMGDEKFNNELAPHIRDWTKDVPQFKEKVEHKLKNLNLK